MRQQETKTKAAKTVRRTKTAPAEPAAAEAKKTATKTKAAAPVRAKRRTKAELAAENHAPIQEELLPVAEAPSPAAKPKRTRVVRKKTEEAAQEAPAAESPAIEPAKPIRRLARRPVTEAGASVPPQESAPVREPAPVATPAAVAERPVVAAERPAHVQAPAPETRRPFHGHGNRPSRFTSRRDRDRDRERDRDRDRDQHRERDSEAYGGAEPVLQAGQEAAGGQRRFEDRPAAVRTYEPIFAEGIVEVSGKGFGFLRDPKRSFVQTPHDVFVTPEVVRRHLLRDGQWIKGEVRRGSRGLQLFRLTEINGEDPEKFRNLPMFEELTTVNPFERIKLETVPDRYTTRVMDLMTPIGKGQRGLLVAPPRTGKTTLLQHIAEAVVKNHPKMKLIILLVDERPEEVTEIRRAVPEAEIMASSNDNDVKSHTRIAQLAIERAKRLAEAGEDVFVLLDSITRMGRAFNNAMANSGRTGSGGLDVRAMEIPRKIFAAARNTEEAGSLTIIGTALVETGSRMDEVIFQEFKGTGNMDLVLDRKISDQRIYPAVDIFQSGTRREELLVPADELEKINVIRRGLAGHKPVEAIDRLLMFLRRFPTNIEMLRGIPGER